MLCQPGQHHCEDGFCRETCPPFNGCPLSKPLHCPAGGCAISYAQCAGLAICPLDKPYRDMNNICTTYPKKDQSTFRATKFNKMTIDVDPNLTTKANILYAPPSTQSLASLEITHTK